jgi:RNA polymerase sigma-70 factor (ECF subfamily)
MLQPGEGGENRWLKEAPDEVLAACVQKGYSRKEAYEELSHRYWQRMKCRFTKYGVDPHTAEDLTQQVCLGLYKNELAGFDPRRPFAPWLYAVVHNQFVSHIRGKWPASLGDASKYPGCVSAATEAERREAERRVAEAMARLLPAEREVLALSMDGAPPREVASRLGVEVKTVYKILERSRKKLRRLLQLDGAGDDPPESGRLGA